MFSRLSSEEGESNPGFDVMPQSMTPVGEADRMPPSMGEMVSRAAAAHELQAEVDRLRAERSLLLDRQRRIMELLGTAVPEKLVHDLRNVLNERELFKALADRLDD